MKNLLKLSLAAGVLAVGVAGCGGGGSGPLDNGGNNGGGGGGGGGNNPTTYTQQERLARPVVNEVFATVAENRHLINDTDNPTDDYARLRTDILGFMKFPAGRSDAIAKAVADTLAPDVMIADLSKPGPAAYLGVETGGATGSTFGGRKLQDDVVDVSLDVIFGTTVSDLGLAPSDGAPTAVFADGDNVGFGAKHFTNSFPYLGSPH